MSRKSIDEISFKAFKQSFDTLQGDARRFKTNYLNPFPLPENISEQDQKPFVDLVDKIFEIKKDGFTSVELELTLDEMVYALYGLSEGEINIINEA